jgi:hypothetical protein
MSLWHAFYFPIRGLGLVWSRKGAEAFIQAGKSMTMPVDIFKAVPISILTCTPQNPSYTQVLLPTL